ncbi:putative TetR family transcriptional regulator [Gordonia effusa NBRC 100432]|uniref:Putative TetR family transcriptional regulator n=1 Tax=Gordonia effusa NBRC 100432 TaxID=1077974 RepID=H0QXT9_9ACTN|nr:TetR/AcrR family transcriptional regulator [Gordonia effusa]GAB17640.1 putative TetR family transcriptional regulator [Gordonia effusa NBRC 100432]
MARRVDKSARRAEILRAGDRLLRDRGLQALQIREVAREAGVAAGTVYTYFATKESLFAALYAEQILRTVEEFKPYLDSPPREQFIRFATSYRDMYGVFGREVDVASFVTPESLVDGRTVEELLSATSQLVELMTEFIAKHDVPQPELTLTILWSLLSGLAMHYSGPRQMFGASDWDEAVGFAADKLVDILLPSTKQ